MGFSYKPLWRLLLDRDIKKTSFAKALGLSSSTLAKLGDDKYVSLEVIDRICSYFKVQVSDVIEHIEDQ